MKTFLTLDSRKELDLLAEFQNEDIHYPETWIKSGIKPLDNAKLFPWHLYSKEVHSVVARIKKNLARRSRNE